MKYHALFVNFEKRQNLKLSSAANYRWRFKGLVDQILPPVVLSFAQLVD